ncbi:MAG: metal-dependent hydrolase [Rhodobacter sp.]|jgi:hypothetical protein|nr:metal-dependent hydrolase [Rhodobacter sp.]
MLTAHLPSGYVLARAVRRPVAALLPVALLGAVLPDLDMIWFHLVDGGSVHHHHYWPHLPAVWGAVALVSLPLLNLKGWLAPGLVFFAAIAMHLILDTIAGGINWSWPAGDQLFAAVTVPAAYSHWIVSFILHWTFALELAVWAMAFWLYFGKTPA